MNPLGLSARAKTQRRKYITASDAARIMTGDWQTLFREKKGLIEPENLDDKLPVQLGSFTEPLNLFWFEKQTGRKVDYYSDNLVAAKAWSMLTGRDAKGEFQQSVEHLWMGCSLDGMSTAADGTPCVIDAKHVGQFRFEELTERYTPAMTHQCVVMDVDHWILSVLVGTSRFEVIEQPLDRFFAEALIEREAEFWDYVQRSEEPPDRRPEAAPKPTPRLRTIDASAAPVGSDNWMLMVAVHNWLPDLWNEAAAFCETEGAHKAHVAARDGIKALLPDDVGLLRLDTPKGLFKAKRATTGALTMTKET